MIKLFSLKQQKKDGEAPKPGGNKKSFTAAQLRITKGKEKFLTKQNVTMINYLTRYCVSIFITKYTDINELNLPKTCATEFPDPDDLLNFKLIICPDEGFYKGGRFVFNFKVSIHL